MERRFTSVSRRDLLRLGLAIPFAPLAQGYSTRVLDLVNQSQVIDMLGLLTLDWRKWERWRQNPALFSPADADQVQSSGIGLFHLAVNLPKAAQTGHWLEDWSRFLSFHRQHFRFVLSLSELAPAPSDRRAAVMLGMQDSRHFETIQDVRRYRKAGQLVSQLTYNGRNRIGTGCYEAEDRGLTPFGVSVIEEMTRSGMVIDISHCGPRTTMEAIEAGRRNALITHSNCGALNPGERRCKSDDEIRKLAAQGGVMGITSISKFVRAAGSACLDDVLDHFDHVVRLVGIEHAGIGSDAPVDGTGGALISNLRGTNRILALTDGLVRRGYTDEHIGLILGGNFARALKAIGAAQNSESSIVLASPSPATN